MKITQGDFAGRRASVKAGLFGNNPRVRVFGRLPHHMRNVYDLTGGEMSVRLVNKERRKSKGHVFVCILLLLLACVMFGPFGLLALPLFWGGNRETVTVQLKTNTGQTSIAVADGKEWGILSQFVSI